MGGFTYVLVGDIELRRGSFSFSAGQISLKRCMFKASQGNLSLFIFSATLLIAFSVQRVIMCVAIMLDNASLGTCCLNGIFKDARLPLTSEQRVGMKLSSHTYIESCEG